MPQSAAPAHITVHGIFDRDHLCEQIIQPNRVFRVTYYFVDNWLPLLKPSPAWLVVALQQSYWQKRRGVITHNALGRQSGLKRHQVMNLLNDTEQFIQTPAGDDGTAAHYISWFLRRIDRSGHSKQGKRANTYTVLLNVPLTPQHQAGLQQILTSIARTHRNIESRVEAIRALCETPRAVLLGRMQNDLPLPAAPLSVSEMVLNACDVGDNHPLHKTVRNIAEQLAQHILQPNAAYLGQQYFREKWIPLLGSNIGWLLTVLRRRGYAAADGTEVRDAFEFSRHALADKLGVSERTLRRSLAGKAGEIKWFISDLTTDKTTLSGHIIVNGDPLVPSDKKLLARQLRSREAKMDNPTTAPAGIGQNPTTAPAGIGQNPTTAPASIGQNSTTAPASIGQNSTTAPASIGQNSTTTPASIGQNSTTESFKALLKSTLTDSAHQQQHRIDDDVGDFPNSMSTEKLLLAEAGIFEPALSQLLTLPHVNLAYVRLWCTWFETQGDFGTGWVIRQMQSGLLPPEEYLPPPPPECPVEPSPSPLEQRWIQLANHLRGTMTAATFHSTVAQARVLSLSEPSPDEPATLTVLAPTSFARTWLGERFKQRIQEVWEMLFGRPIALVVEEFDFDAQDTGY